MKQPERILTFQGQREEEQLVKMNEKVGPDI